MSDATTENKVYELFILSSEGKIVEKATFNDEVECDESPTHTIIRGFDENDNDQIILVGSIHSAILKKKHRP